MRVLFLCTGNSARSQIAEGLLRAHSRGAVESFSAGTEPSSVHPLVAEVMGGIGIDVSAQTSKHLDRYVDEKFDYVITVCDRVKETCPSWPNATAIHWSFDDPANSRNEREARLAFVAVRNAIAHRIRLFLLSHRVDVERERTP